MKAFLRVSLAIVAVSPLAAQSFEAASITPLKGGAGRIHFTVLPNRLDVQNLSLAYLIEQAYDVPDFQLSGPDAVLAHRYDIQATSGAAVSRADMMGMLRNLLGVRFHLQTHWETRTEAAYRLTVAPGGAKMKASETGYAGGNSPMLNGSTAQLNGPMSMRQLAERLNGFLHRPVVDATNLDGYYTIALTFDTDDLAGRASEAAMLQPLLPKALEQQLGLKLVAGKEPIRYLMVDHADAVPTEN